MKESLSRFQGETPLLGDRVFVLREWMRQENPIVGRHCDRVTEILQKMLAHTSYDPVERQTLLRASFIHDIGKAELEKGWAFTKGPNQLTEEERKTVWQHPTRGAEWAIKNGLYELAPIILHHHEHWDGTGFYGIKGYEIDQRASLIEYADALEAMTSTERPYRQPKTMPQALVAVENGIGTQFDPRHLETFESFVNEVHRDRQEGIIYVQNGTV
jgi:HD-GYP domain-containing protein (c-di-GMP phosphodiesterase class II)